MTERSRPARPTSAPSRRRRAAVVVLATAAAAFAVVIAVRATRGPATVDAQGTLHPGTTEAPAVGSTPRRQGTLAPATTASTTTSTVAVPTPSPPSTPAPQPTVARRPPPTDPVPGPTEPPEAPPDPEPAPVPAAGDAPVRLAIERLGLDAPVVTVGVTAGTNAVEIPPLDDVGWYRYGARPGDAIGTVVLVGHVDGNGRPGVFARLRDLAPGDAIDVTAPDGAARRYVVTGLEEFPKQALPTDLFVRAGAPRLALITCGGAFDRATGHYVDNVVVVAAPA